MSPRMYRSTIRNLSVQDGRNKIAAAAANLIASTEPSRFSLESVGKAAGVSRLTVYNHFGSRKGLLEVVYDNVAERGGLYRIPEAFKVLDPVTGIDRLVSIFCDFWSIEFQALQGLYAASVLDSEFQVSLQGRNERRREALTVLTQRLNQSEDLSTLVDILFVLTSFQVFSELSIGRDAAGATAIVKNMIGNAISTYRTS